MHFYVELVKFLDYFFMRCAIFLEKVNYFKTSKRTITPKATQIQKMFDMYPFHPEFSTWHMLYKCSVVNM